MISAIHLANVFLQNVCLKKKKKKSQIKGVLGWSCLRRQKRVPASTIYELQPSRVGSDV